MAAKSDNLRFYLLDEKILEHGNGVFVTSIGEEFLAVILPIYDANISGLSERSWNCSRLRDVLGQFIPAPENWRDYKHTEIPVAQFSASYE